MTLHDQNTIAGDTNAAANVIGYRDALDRASRIRTEAEASNAYSVALAGGDTDMIKALRLTATQNGWTIDQPLSVAYTVESKKARALLVDLLNLAAASPGTLAAGENFNDRRLTADAIKEERLAQVAASIKDMGAKAEVLLNQIGSLAEKANKRADLVRPALNPNDANQLTRTAQAWQFNVLPQLSTGTNPNWASILDGLDLDGLFGVQRFAPAWIKANTKDPMAVAENIDNALDGVPPRITNAVTDVNVRSALVNAQDASDYLTAGINLARGVITARTSRDATLLGMSVQNTAYKIGALSELTPTVQGGPSAPKFNRIG